MRRGPVSVLAVVCLLLAGMGIDEIGRPGDDRGGRTSPAAAQTRPVATSTLVCPLSRYEAGRTGNNLAVATLGAAGDTDEGSVLARPLDEAVDAPAVEVTPPTGSQSPAPTPSTSSTSSPSTSSPSASPSATEPESLLPAPGTADLGFGPQREADVTTEIDGSGALAPGLAAELYTRGEAGPDRGTSSTACSAPATEQYFIGASTVVGAATRMVLANPEDADAVVDITFLGPDGPLSPSAGQGLTVPARSRSLLALENLVPDAEWLAVAVRTRTGRVAAAVQQYRGTPDEPKGIDWLPGAATLGRAATVVGIPGGLTRYTLLVANPSDLQVSVDVQIATTDGQFAPVGLDQVQVPARSLTAVDATEALRGGPSTLLLSGDGDLLAGVAMSTDSVSTPLAEIAYAGQAEPLSTPGVLANVRDVAGTTDSLLLSAVGGDVTATLTPLQVVGQDPPPAPRTVQVPAGRTAEVVLGELLGPGGFLPLQISRTGGAGELYAAQSMVEEGDRGLLVTGHPVQPQLTEVRLPGVINDISVSRP